MTLEDLATIIKPILPEKVFYGTNVWHFSII